MKGKIIKVALVVLLVLVALWLNPRDIYYRVTAEKEMVSMSLNYFQLHKGEEVKEVQYLGGNVYLLETDKSMYLVKRERTGAGSQQFDIFQHEVTSAHFGTK